MQDKPSVNMGHYSQTVGCESSGDEVTALFRSVTSKNGKNKYVMYRIAYSGQTVPHAPIATMGDY